jgi:hypothetical protein
VRDGKTTGKEPAATAAPEEPVWLVRVVLLLFMAAFSAFLAWEGRNVLRALWAMWG